MAGANDEVLAAYLFGSTARGDERPGSDLDIALLYRREPPRTLRGLGLDLQADLEESVQRPVQVVVLNRAPADLIQRVLRDGKILLDRDKALRLRFEVQARNEYFDLLPILRQYRQAQLSKP